MSKRLLQWCILSSIVACASLAQESEPVAHAAKWVFEEAATLSARDAGNLWGAELYGPMLLVDPESRRVVANRSTETLVHSGDVYIGVLPDSVGIANTSMNWAGREWTMLMWPLPEDDYDRRSLIAHELWHRIQDELGFPSRSGANLHLGTRDGRIWLQLEWRALSAALRTNGDAQLEHVRDALVFRAKRMNVFPQAEEDERLLIMHEGLAQYTGYALSGRSPGENRERAAREIDGMVDAPTFVRAFAYPTGAAYGLLLDVSDPAWRAELESSDDLSRLCGLAIDFEVSEEVLLHVSSVADAYDGPSLIANEDRLEIERQTRLDDYRRRFVDGPTLNLSFVRMSVEFDPGTVDALDDLGKIYPALRLKDAWGVLHVDGGALITADWQKVVVPAPFDTLGNIYSGEGYSLELAEGWELAAAVRGGDLTVWRSTVAEPEEVTFRTRDDVTIHGDLYQVHPTSAPLILLFHQGASNARAEYRSIVPRLLDAGFNLLAIDQRRGGSRFGGSNRTVAGLSGREYSYCDCYEDLESALDYTVSTLGSEKIIAWGSSYSAALVFRLGVEHPDELAAVLAFSPASGEPMAGCYPEPFAKQITLPTLVLRPAREMQLDHVATQFEELRNMGHQMYIADPAVHGSSMLNVNRVDGDIEKTWHVVLDFLSSTK